MSEGGLLEHILRSGFTSLRIRRSNGYAKLGANSFCLMHADGCDRGCVLVNWRFLISSCAQCASFLIFSHILSITQFLLHMLDVGQ
jgi:hypothetical protein